MKRLRSIDFFTVMTVSILFLIGLFVQYSTTPLTGAKEGWVESLVVRQTLFAVFAIVVTWAISSIDPQIGKTVLFQILILVVSIVLLGGLFIFGPIVNETHRWYQFGAFLFQPSEFVKIALIMWTAYWLSHAQQVGMRIIIGVTGLAAALSLILLQPDFGATLIILLAILFMAVVWAVQFAYGKRLVFFLTVAGAIVFLAAQFTWLLLGFLVLLVLFMFARYGAKTGTLMVLITTLVSGVVVGIVVAWNTGLIPDYVKKRVVDFTAENITHQVRQSKIAIGSGQLAGKGIAQGTQTRLRFLPEYTTDFIFAAYAEERGFIGVLILLLLYLFLYGRFLYFAMQTEDEYSRLLIIGLTIKLWFETFLNIGMNMGIMPTKGVALPFLSYGGSSLLANTIIVGIILTLYRHEGKRDTI